MRKDAEAVKEGEETPDMLGYTMPPAWGRHARSWMAWPCREALWGGALGAARQAYAEVARAITRFEPVIMAVRPEQADEAARICGDAVTMWPVALDDSWARDIAPVFIRNREGTVAGVDWDFNGWGGKYVPYARDAEFARHLLARQGLRRFAAGMVLEGGAIHCDGAGVLMTTEECLLNPNRNPGRDRAAIEDRLKAYLGLRKILWLGEGLYGDETDGHVDNVACFAEGGIVLLAMPATSSDPSYAAMRQNAARLRAARDAEGAPLRVIEVPLPRPKNDAQGHPLTRSYINFAVANGGLVLPAFDDPADQAAAQIIGAVFPGRDIVQIDANPIVRGGGGIHCITYEEPEAR